jgi:16S rRNA (guanine966-N2)-methyltransferase
MRVIAGSAGGRPLHAPPGRSTRPTSERVREALFSSLADDIPDARVLDLYAGSGALGIEALSRGAASAVLVEQDARTVGILRRNLERTGMAERALVVREDARRFCRDPRGRQRRARQRPEADPGAVPAATLGPFDLVFVDAPYRDSLRLLYRDLDGLRAAGVLSTRVTVVIERPRRDPVLAEAPPPWLALVRDRSYGETVLRYLRRRPGDHSGDDPGDGPGRDRHELEASERQEPRT